MNAANKAESKGPWYYASRWQFDLALGLTWLCWTAQRLGGLVNQPGVELSDLLLAALPVAIAAVVPFLIVATALVEQEGKYLARQLPALEERIRSLREVNKALHDMLARREGRS